MLYAEGHIPWNKGIKCPKISIARIAFLSNRENNPMWGKHHSEETKEKIRAGNLGKKMPRLAIEKTRKANKGNKYRLGKYHTEETKKKISESKKGIKLNISEETQKRLSELRSGVNHWNWKGGTSTERDTVTCTKEYREWREAVFERDDFTCQRCLTRGGKGNPVYLHPHHIIPFAIAPEERLEVDNGATLCIDCHRWIHSNEYEYIGG